MKIEGNILVVKQKKENYVDWDVKDKEQTADYKCITPIQQRKMTKIIS